jgi:nucleoid-associated protein YgaU
MSTLQKAIIQRLKADGSLDGSPFKVQFNPTEYTLNKGVQISEVAIPGLDTPILQFVRGQTESLTLDLFFDTTEDGTGFDATPVTTQTDQFYELVKIDKNTHAPPICLFSWGSTGFAGANFSDQWGSQKRENGFQCIVESVRQRFTLFSPEGLPLRAILTVTLKEYWDLKRQLERLDLHSPDHTHAHVVATRDTLSKIAADVYGDPNQWRAIAEKNGLVDPLDLKPGLVLEIPPIR